MENEPQRYDTTSSGRGPYANGPQRYAMPSSSRERYPNDGSENPWRAGHLIYFNRADPRTIVPKYSGMGLTFNFARPVTLWVTLGPFLLIAAVLLMMFFVFTADHIPAAAFFSATPLLILLLLFLIVFIIHLRGLLNSRPYKY